MKKWQEGRKQEKGVPIYLKDREMQKKERKSDKNREGGKGREIYIYIEREIYRENR